MMIIEIPNIRSIASYYTDYTVAYYNIHHTTTGALTLTGFAKKLEKGSIKVGHYEFITAWTKK